MYKRQGLLQAASIPKLSHIQIDHTAVTYEGLLAIAGNNRIEPVSHVQFTREQMEYFSQLQREKAKNPVQLDKQAVEECRRVLSAFLDVYKRQPWQCRTKIRSWPTT